MVAAPQALVCKLAGAGDARHPVREKQWRETLVQGDDEPAWTWPARQGCNEIRPARRKAL
jgi:hypothetical protein